MVGADLGDLLQGVHRKTGNGGGQRREIGRGRNGSGIFPVQRAQRQFQFRRRRQWDAHQLHLRGEHDERIQIGQIVGDQEADEGQQ